MTLLPTVCVIGAGASGITAAKALHEHGFTFECFEASDRVGGNWVFGNRNGMSSAYRSLHINTSRERMEFSDFPMPSTYPDFPHHTQIAAYFDAYVDHFGLRDEITFQTLVTRAERRADGGWDVTTEPGGTRAYDVLVVANGHHWDPRWPEPAFPGHERFTGVQLHSHQYTGDDPALFRDRAVVVLGMGNSAMDIAVESSFTAARTFLAARRGAWVIPKYVFGRPLDTLGLSPRIPSPVRRRLQEATLRLMVGDMERYGLPKPDHRFGEAHPTVSDDVLSRIAHGEITPKPNIAELTERTARFADGSEEPADVVVYCTGYKVTFPFLDPALIAAPDNDLPLFRRRVPPGRRRDLLRRAPAAARRDHAAGRAAVAVDLRPPRGPLPPPARGGDARRHGGRAGHDVQALRRLQAPHDAGRLRGLRAGRRAGAPARRAPRRAGRRTAAGAAAGGRGVTALATGRRERAKAANRAALIEAARDAFGELGFEAAGVRDIVRRTELASGTFYNYFPDKEAVFRAVVAATGAEARRRVHAARSGARDLETFVAAGYRAYFAFIVEDPATFAFLRRNVGTLGARGLEDVLPLGAAELRADLAALGGRGAPAGVDLDYLAHAMVAVGVELGARMAEREPPDVEGATRFATGLFLAALNRS